MPGFINRHIGQGSLRHLHIFALGPDAFCVNLHFDCDGRAPDLDDTAEERQQIAHPHRLLEDKFIDRHRRHAAHGVARGHHRTGQVNLRHDPAAKDVAIRIAVARHGDDFEHQFLVDGQLDGIKA